jgi:hypothetical protein
MVEPFILCRQHLLGEHSEIHKHKHNFQKGHSIAGRIAGNAVEPLAMQDRHDELVREMLRRNYNHKSPYEQPDLSAYSDKERNFRVDRDASLLMLVERCGDCALRFAALEMT